MKSGKFISFNKLLENSNTTQFFCLRFIVLLVAFSWNALKQVSSNFESFIYFDILVKRKKIAGLDWNNKNYTHVLICSLVILIGLAYISTEMLSIILGAKITVITMISFRFYSIYSSMLFMVVYLLSSFFLLFLCFHDSSAQLDVNFGRKHLIHHVRWHV